MIEEAAEADLKHHTKIGKPNTKRKERAIMMTKREITEGKNKTLTRILITSNISMVLDPNTKE